MNLTLVLKTRLGFSALVLLMLVGSVTSYIKFGQLSSHLGRTTDVISPMVAESQALGSNLLNTNMSLMFFANTLEPDQLPKHKQLYTQRKATYQQSYDKLLALVSENPQLTAELNQVDALNQQIFALNDQHFAKHEQWLMAFLTVGERYADFKEEWDFFAEDMKEVAINADSNDVKWAAEFFEKQGSVIAAVLDEIMRTTELSQVQELVKAVEEQQLRVMQDKVKVIYEKSGDADLAKP